MSSTVDETLFAFPVKQHEKHWVSDGNVVLSADSGHGCWTYLYRIHMSLLSDHSEVFESMFDLPQGGDEGCSGGAEMCAGLPLVRLPDTAEEVGAMLDALRNPLPFAEKSGHSDTPLRIRDALHMASKYLMTSLRESLVRIVESEWPTTVDSFDARDELFCDYLERGRTYKAESLRNGWPIVWLQEPGAAIALAEDFDIPSILPAAYYDLTRCSPTFDWEDFFFDRLPRQSRKPARWNCLSRQSLCLLNRLHELLLGFAEEVYWDLDQSDKGSDECSFRGKESLGDCKRTWMHLMMEASDLHLRPQERDLLLDLRKLRKQVINNDGKICLNCQKEYVMEIDEWRYEAWELVRECCTE